MAKRFFDSRKYQDPWFRKLSPAHKLFWDYLLCSCNHAGIWKKDFEMASFCIGVDVDEKGIRESMNGRIVELKDDKWFVPKFIEFQYGQLSADSKPHQSVITELIKEGLYEQYGKGLLTPKDKDKDKDKEKDKDIYMQFPEIAQNLRLFVEMRKKIKAPITDHALDLVIKKLSKYTPKQANEMLEQSIERSYRGVFEVDARKDKQKPNQIPDL